MKIAIFGGNLQGTEAAYLSKKLGWEVLLFDKVQTVPASGLCDRFIMLQVAEGNRPDKALMDVDLIIPAFENETVLHILNQWGRELEIPVAFDPSAYGISNSKKESNILFERMGLDVPKRHPESCHSMISKPDRDSGSRGVRLLQGNEAITAFVQDTYTEKDWVLQEFVEGPSYSIEVIGCAGKYTAFQVTELFFDEQFDCKRVIAPANLSPDIDRELKNISVSIAEKLNLTGIMDVEVIYSEKKLKLLEIDARLPSQTPSAVFWSTGINMLALLSEVFIEHSLKETHNYAAERHVLYEHIRVDIDTIKIGGEHIMTQEEPLVIHQGFFGADEAISNYQNGKEAWVATMIYSDVNFEALIKKRQLVIKNIMNEFGIKTVVDKDPVMVFSE